IDHERRMQHVILHVVRRDLRPVCGTRRLQRAQPGVEARVGADAPRAHMIRMALVRPGSEGNARTMAANDFDHLQLLVSAGAQAAIAEIELISELDAEDLRGALRFAIADLRRAARSHLAARQLDESDLETILHRLGDRAATRQLDIVGVSSEEKQIHLFVHSAITLQTGESGSISSIIRSTSSLSCCRKKGIHPTTRSCTWRSG